MNDSLSPTRLVVLGGFLGAGKTTALLRLARGVVARGQTVGVITNDQGEQLVDTALFAAAGFDTRDVRGGCFCCRLDDFLDRAAEFRTATRPDYLIAEPVGSCTDIVATVMRPLATLHANAFSLAPYCVLVDPMRALDALGPRGAASLSEKVTYIYRLQQMEADTLVITKADLVPAAVLDEVQALLAARFEGKRVMRMSSTTGEGFQAFESLLLDGNRALPRSPEVDYDVYAAGEAELAWFDGMYQVECRGLPMQSTLVELARLIAHRLSAAGAGVVHAKLHAASAGDSCAVSVVAPASEPRVSSGSTAFVDGFDLIVNTRAHGPADAVRAMVDEAMAQWATGRAAVTVLAREGFSPGRPMPTVRLE